MYQGALPAQAQGQALLAPGLGSSATWCRVPSPRELHRGLSAVREFLPATLHIDSSARRGPFSRPSLRAFRFSDSPCSRSWCGSMVESWGGCVARFAPGGAAVRDSRTEPACQRLVQEVHPAPARTRTNANGPWRLIGPTVRLPPRAHSSMTDNRHQGSSSTVADGPPWTFPATPAASPLDDLQLHGNVHAAHGPLENAGTQVESMRQRPVKEANVRETFA